MAQKTSFLATTVRESVIENCIKTPGVSGLRREERQQQSLRNIQGCKKHPGKKMIARSALGYGNVTCSSLRFIITIPVCSITVDDVYFRMVKREQW